mgnify:CR=1 FL=1
MEIFEAQLKNIEDTASFLQSFSKKVYDDELEEYYDEVLTKINSFLTKEKVEFIYEAPILLTIAKIEFAKKNYDEVASIINQYDNQLIKYSNDQLKFIKEGSIKLLISIKKYKQAFQILDSYETLYEKMSYLFLFNNKLNPKEQTALNKQILSFTKKNIK